MRVLRLFCFLLFGALFFPLPLWGQSESAVLPETLLQQDVLWKGYRLKLTTSPARPAPFSPVEILIVAKKESTLSPFVGNITLGFEDLSKDPGNLHETALGPDDFEEAGVARVGHTFTRPGHYAVTVTFTDPEGEFYLLRGKIEVPGPAGLSLKSKILLFIAAALILCVAVFLKVRTFKK